MVKKIKKLKEELIKRKDDAYATVKLFAKLKYPKFERKTEYFSYTKRNKNTLDNNM